LVRLHFVAFSLHVDELLNTWLHEAMVAASYTLLKAQAREKLTKVLEADIGI
jgi:hypothetical protein